MLRPCRSCQDRAMTARTRQMKINLNTAASRIHPALAAACILSLACVALPQPVRAGELWGAHGAYHFDHTKGDEGYGISWNHPDPQGAIDEALRQAVPRKSATASRPHSERASVRSGTRTTMRRPRFRILERRSRSRTCPRDAGLGLGPGLRPAHCAPPSIQATASTSCSLGTASPIAHYPTQSQSERSGSQYVTF